MLITRSGGVGAPSDQAARLPLDISQADAANMVDVGERQRARRPCHDPAAALYSTGNGSSGPTRLSCLSLEDRRRLALAAHGEGRCPLCGSFLQSSEAKCPKLATPIPRSTS